LSVRHGFVGASGPVAGAVEVHVGFSVGVRRRGLGDVRILTSFKSEKNQLTKKIAGFLAIAFVLGSAAAQASPVVKASITQSIVSHDASGAVVLAPVAANASLKPGTVVEYTIVAMNDGNEAARNLKPAAKIPASTSFRVGSAVSSVADAKAEFSLDGGKTWSAMPMVSVSTPQGLVQRPADASKYQAIRWSDPQSLAANGRATFSYDVTVR